MAVICVKEHAFHASNLAHNRGSDSLAVPSVCCQTQSDPSTVRRGVVVSGAVRASHSRFELRLQLALLFCLLYTVGAIAFALAQPSHDFDFLRPV